MSENAQFPDEFESFSAFREQAADYLGFGSDMVIAGFPITHPQNLDPDQQERYDELRILIEESDEFARYPDGSVKDPLRSKDGKRLESYDVRVAKAWLGGSYDDFIAKGGRAKDLYNATLIMNKEYLERKRADPKSGNGAGSSS